MNRAAILRSTAFSRAVTALAATALAVFAQPAPAGAAPACRVPAPHERAHLASVIDGDTLALTDGRHVRLIGVNAPEKARRGRAAEPGAQQALEFTRSFLGSGGMELAEGADSRDRYDRTLAHVFRRDGRSLEQALIGAGLARVAVVPPNLALAECLLATEHGARAARVGLWASDAFAPRSVASLREREAGFRLLRGELGALQKTRASWWIELDGRVALQISRADWRHFDEQALGRLGGREVEVRGWLVWRDSAQNRARNRAPWLLRIGHPLAIRELPEDD